MEIDFNFEQIDVTKCVPSENCFAIHSTEIDIVDFKNKKFLERDSYRCIKLFFLARSTKFLKRNSL